MTAKEKEVIAGLCTFIVFSLTAGYYSAFGLPDAVYFFFRQLSEFILLASLYIILKHIKYLTASLICKGLMILSLVELIDEVLLNNYHINLSDFAIIPIAIFITIKIISNGRHKT